MSEKEYGKNMNVNMNKGTKSGNGMKKDQQLS